MKKQTYKPNLLEALRRQLRSLRMRGDSFRRRHRHRDRSFRDHTREPEDMRLLERRTSQRANSVFFIVLFVCCFLSCHVVKESSQSLIFPSDNSIFTCRARICSSSF